MGAFALRYEPSTTSISGGETLSGDGIVSVISTPFGLDGFGRTLQLIKSPVSTNVVVTVSGIGPGLRQVADSVILPAGIETGETDTPFVKVDSITAKQSGSAATYYIGFGHGNWASSGYWDAGPSIPSAVSAFSIWADGSSITTETLVNRAQGTFSFPDYAWPVAGDDMPVIYQWMIVD